MEEHQEKMQSFEEVLISVERIIKLEPEEPDCLPQSHATEESTQVKPFEEILFSGTEDHAVKLKLEKDPLDCVPQNDNAKLQC
ncbi:hypothetical protein B566_EDAN001056 [Ephemera danica]|nr:hypothetical protein B566_EDAN001056 [Ephemera danica]